MTSQTPGEHSIHMSYGELIDFVAKCRTPLHFLLQVFTTCINLISCKTVMDVGGKTHNYDNNNNNNNNNNLILILRAFHEVIMCALHNFYL